MISLSFFYTLLFSTTFAGSNTNITSINSQLAPIVEWQNGPYKEQVSKNVAVKRLNQILDDLGPTEVVRTHPAKLNAKRDTYGLIHLSNGEESIRIFYFCQKLGYKHVINKLKITTI